MHLRGVGRNTLHIGLGDGQVGHVANFLQDGVGLDILHLIGSLYRGEGEDGVGVVSQLIHRITAVQLPEQILADLGVLGVGVDTHALGSCNAEGLRVVLGSREYGKAHILGKLLGGLVHSAGYIGGGVDGSIVSKGGAVTYHGIDGGPTHLAEIGGGDLGGVGVVVDLLEEAQDALVIEQQLAVLADILAAQSHQNIQKIAAGAGTVCQSPLSSALGLYLGTEIQELLPGKLAAGHLLGQRSHLLVGPADLLQGSLVVVDNAHRQVEGHTVGLAIHHEGSIDVLNKVSGHHIGDVQQHTGLDKTGHIAVQ